MKQRHMFRCCATALAVVIATMAGAQKQSGAPSAQPPTDIGAAMVAAEAAAKRPGDEAMNCDALQSELVANMRDPAVQDAAKKQGAWGQEQVDKLNKGVADSKPSTGSIAAQMAMGIASGLSPALGKALTVTSTAAEATRVQTQIAQAQANQAQLEERMQDMIKILPQLMRSQRLLELTQAKKCDWAAPSPPK